MTPTPLVTMSNGPATAAPLLSIQPGRPAPRVAVLTATYGAGHNSAARELARELRAAGCEVVVHDLVPMLPWRLGPMLRAVYYAQLRKRPGSWGTTLRLLEPGRRLHATATTLLRLAVAPVLEVSRGCDLVLTTHPFGAQALGHARLTGQLDAPAVTYLTDTSVHSLWIHPGVDLNLAITEISAEEARGWGGTAAVVRPLVPPACGLPGDGDPLEDVGDLVHRRTRVLVTGGSLGMGELERTAHDLTSCGVTPVVLCGTDTRLQRRLARESGVLALGWRDDIPALMASCEAIVQNAGGFTSLEALASGTPVITYRPLPGHGVANSLNLERAGLIPWARTLEDLTVLLRAARLASRVDRLPRVAPSLLPLLTGGPAHVVAA